MNGRIRNICCVIFKGVSCELVFFLGSESSHLKELDLSANDFMDTGLRDLCVGLKSQRCTLRTLRF